MSKTIITRNVMALIYLDPTDLLTKYGIVGSGIADQSEEAKIDMKERIPVFEKASGLFYSGYGWPIDKGTEVEVARLIDIPEHSGSIRNYRATNLEVFIIPATEGTWNKEKTNG